MTGAACLILAACLAPADAAPQPPEPAPRKPAPLDVARAIDDLDAGDWVLRHRAIVQLGRWRAERAAEPLRKLLEGDGHPWLRGRALRALAEIVGEKMLPVAMKHARSGEPALRAAAVETLGALGSSKADATVRAALKDKDLAVRCQAVLAAGRLWGRDAWPIAQPLLDAEDTPVELLRYAVRALRFVGTDEAVKRLVELLAHDDAGVRFEAVGALGSFRRPEHIVPLLGRAADGKGDAIRHRATEALLAYPPEVLRRRLVEVICESESLSLAFDAVRLLGRVGDEEARNAVAAAYRRNPERFERSPEAVLAAIAPGDADARKDIFLDALDANDADVRKTAVRAVTRCESVDLFDALKPRLTDESSSVRKVAISALAEATTGSPPEGMLSYLSAALTSDDWDTVERALAVLVERAAPEELPAAVRLLDRPLGGPDADRRRHVARAFAGAESPGTRRAVAAAQGYLTRWQLLGPLPNDRENRGFVRPFPPERGVDLDRALPDYRMHAKADIEPVGGNGSPPGVRITPPAVAPGRTIATWSIDVPENAPSLRTAVSLAEGEGRNKPVRAAVAIDGNDVWSAALADADDANEIELPLADHAGRTIELSLVAAAGEAGARPVLFANPRIVAAGATTALAAMLDAALTRCIAPGQEQRPLAWQGWQVDGVRGRVALHDAFPPPVHHNVAYALTELHAVTAGPVRLEVRHDDGCAIWLNGKEVYREGEAGDGEAEVTLPAGKSRLLVKVANLREWWRFAVRVTDEKGARTPRVTFAP